MGYTNYWKQSQDFTQAEWVKIQSNASAITKHAREKLGIPLDVRSDNEHLVIDGTMEDAHETFILEKLADDFAFCKTASKPYDVVVKAILMSAKAHAPDSINIRSDGMKGGDAGDIKLWTNAVDLQSKALGKTYDLTKIFNNDDEEFAYLVMESCDAEKTEKPQEQNSRINELSYLLDSFNEQSHEQSDEWVDVDITDEMFLEYLREREFDSDCEAHAELLKLLENDSSSAKPQELGM